MHRALQIEDILYSIFHHFVPVVDMDMLRCELPDSDPVLPALARTCRAFKEPAMNALWMVLNDLSPLVRCMPKASRQLSSRHKVRWLRVFSPLYLTLSFCSCYRNSVSFADIHLLHRPTGIAFKVTHVAFGPYIASRDSTDSYDFCKRAHR